jgi:hypothetical protein
MPQGLLGLLLLLHLAGAFRQPQPQHAPMQRPAPTPTPPAKGSPQAQGAHGIGQGYQGSLAAVRGGLGSLQNTAGLHPHQMNPQQNPFSFLAGLR